MLEKSVFEIDKSTFMKIHVGTFMELWDNLGFPPENKENFKYTLEVTMNLKEDDIVFIEREGKNIGKLARVVKEEAMWKKINEIEIIQRQVIFEKYKRISVYNPTIIQ